MKLRLARVAIAVALVAVATLVGEIADADLTVAALVLLVAVVLASLLGPVPGGVAAVAGFLALNWFFTPPVHTLEIANGDDVIAAVTFVVTSVLIGGVVTRLRALRREADRRAREVQLRLELTGRMETGDDLGAIAQRAAEAIAGLFELATCTVHFGSVAATTDGHATESAGVVASTSGEVSVEGTRLAGALHDDDQAVLDALVSALASAYERARLEHETRETRVAIQVARSRAGLLSAVSHNLRTPLASIKAAASTLRSPDVTLAPDDRRDLLDTVVEETERLERMVTKTLDLSRIRAGGLQLERQEVDIGDLAAAAVRRLRPLSRAHRVRLRIDPELPPISVDIAAIETVFLNLLENALRHAPPGSEIVVSTDAEPSLVTVRVVDHGQGVRQDDRVRIFDDFVRADDRTDTTGAGLGLAIVRALVAAHGGEVWCEPTTPNGATFVFTLPVGDQG